MSKITASDDDKHEIKDDCKDTAKDANNKDDNNNDTKDDDNKNDKKDDCKDEKIDLDSLNNKIDDHMSIESRYSSDIGPVNTFFADDSDNMSESSSEVSATSNHGLDDNIIDVTVQNTSLREDDNKNKSKGRRPSFARGASGLASELTAIRKCKNVIVVGLAVAALSVCVAVYILSKRDEDEDFSKDFEKHAFRVIDAFQRNARQSFGTIRNLALAITSHSNFAQTKFPFTTLPDWEVRCASTRELASVMSVWMVPIVEEEDRSNWELYSIENQQWLKEGLQIQNKRASGLDSIPSSIYKVEGLAPAVEGGPGPYYPVWQVAPAVPLPTLVNFNLLSHPGYRDAIEVLVETEKPVVGRSFDYSDPDDMQTAGRRDMFNLVLRSTEDEGASYQDDPVSDLYYPVFDTLTGSAHKLVGFLTSIIYWRTYLTSILPEDVHGVVVVFENTCNQTYTYQIDGEQVYYLGPGDLHDRKYDVLEVSQSFYTSLESSFDGEGNTTSQSAAGSCDYTLHVFPSEEFEEEYRTSKPLTYTMSLAGFLLVFVVLSNVH